MAVTITVNGIDELKAKLTTLEQMKKVIGAIQSEADDLREVMKTYPTNAHGPNMAMRGKSEGAAKIRRGFFARLKSGAISVPYARTMNLNTSWLVSSENQGWKAIVGNNMSYNSLVQGPDQTYGHANSGWLTVDKAAETYGPGIIERITAALEEEVADVG
jgi:hypothetical protein